MFTLDSLYLYNTRRWSITKPTGNPIGRPKAKKLPRGRPKGQEAIMKDYRMRMLNSPKSSQVLQTVLDVACDPDHKNWAAASKLVVDRIMPMTAFSEAKAENGKIEINITGLTASVPETVDAEFTEVKDES